MSKPTDSEIVGLNQVRKLPFYRKLFNPLKRGSMRNVVFLWVRLTIGVGVFTLPYLVGQLGVFGGILALVTCFVIC